MEQQYPPIWKYIYGSSHNPATGAYCACVCRFSSSVNIVMHMLYDSVYTSLSRFDVKLSFTGRTSQT